MWHHIVTLLSFTSPSYKQDHVECMEQGNRWCRTWRLGKGKQVVPKAFFYFWGKKLNFPPLCMAVLQPSCENVKKVKTIRAFLLTPVQNKWRRTSLEGMTVGPRAPLDCLFCVVKTDEEQQHVSVESITNILLTSLWVQTVNTKWELAFNYCTHSHYWIHCWTLKGKYV